MSLQMRLGDRFRRKIAALAIAGAASCCLVAIAPRAEAEDLNSALAAAYMNNPTLRAERARQRGTDEQVSQALAGWRPTIIASGDAGHSDVDGNPSIATSTTDPRGLSVRLTQPVFRGFQTINGTLEAESAISAGQQTLLSIEQTVLLDGVTAYTNVVRDSRIAQLRAENVSNLSKQLDGTEARFNVGELTQTDVAQSRARLSQARSDLATARSNLEASRAAYVRVIGRSPDGLGLPDAVSGMLPGSLEEAIAISETRNPTVLAARFNEESSSHAVEVAVGDLLPTIDFTAEYSYREEPSAAISSTETLSVTGSVSVPLYQSGSEHSRVRQAKQLNSQRRLQVIESMRQVREEVVTSWNLLVAARESIRSDRDQVEANELAFRGIQQEANVGSRTILDVLDTNRDLIESKILLAGSRRDEVVASYRLLAAVGSLTAGHLGLPVTLYDPSVNLDQVRDQLFGFDVEQPE